MIIIETYEKFSSLISRQLKIILGVNVYKIFMDHLLDEIRN